MQEREGGGKESAEERKEGREEGSGGRENKKRAPSSSSSCCIARLHFKTNKASYPWHSLCGGNQEQEGTDVSFYPPKAASG